MRHDAVFNTFIDNVEMIFILSIKLDVTDDSNIHQFSIHYDFSYYMFDILLNDQWLMIAIESKNILRLDQRDNIHLQSIKNRSRM